MGVLRAAAAEPCGLAELCARTGLPRATAHRLAVGLEVHGLLHRGTDGRWRPGPALAELAHRGVDPLLEAAAAVLPRLRDITGESVQLYRRDGMQRVCVAAAEPASGLRDTVPVGTRLPMTAGLGRQGPRGLGGPRHPARAAAGGDVHRTRAARRAPARLGAERGRARGGRGERVGAGARRARARWSRPSRCRARSTGSAGAPASGGRPTSWRRRTPCSTGCSAPGRAHRGAGAHVPACATTAGRLCEQHGVREAALDRPPLPARVRPAAPVRGQPRLTCRWPPDDRAAPRSTAARRSGVSPTASCRPPGRARGGPVTALRSRRAPAPDEGAA